MITFWYREYVLVDRDKALEFEYFSDFGTRSPELYQL